MIKKPASIANSSFKSAKWDEITKGRNFQQSDIPTIALLCQWHEVVEKCMDDLTYGDSIQVAYQNDIGDVKAFPQLATMKQASAEIRAINKQLGINDEAVPQETKRKDSKLALIQAARLSKAKNTA